jgi:hypothetical protein
LQIEYEEREPLGGRMRRDVSETVQLTTSYRYASPRARDEAVIAALGQLGESSVHYEITLGSVLTVNVALQLFADHDFTLFELLARDSIESRVVITA